MSELELFPLLVKSHLLRNRGGRNLRSRSSLVGSQDGVTIIQLLVQGPGSAAEGWWGISRVTLRRLTASLNHRTLLAKEELNCVQGRPAPAPENWRSGKSYCCQ